MIGVLFNIMLYCNMDDFACAVLNVLGLSRTREVALFTYFVSTSTSLEMVP